MPNHSEKSTHVSSLSEPSAPSASDVDERVERGESVNNIGCKEQGASDSRSQKASKDLYEQMCQELYNYHFKTISFLELLTKWEQLLQITPPLPDPDLVRP